MLRETDIKIEEIGNGYLLTLGGLKKFAPDPDAVGLMVTTHLDSCRSREEVVFAQLEKRFAADDDI